MTLPPTSLCWWEYTSPLSQVNDAKDQKDTEISKEFKVRIPNCTYKVIKLIRISLMALWVQFGITF